MNKPLTPAAGSLIEDISLRGFSEKTQRYYIRIVSRFAALPEWGARVFLHGLMAKRTFVTRASTLFLFREVRQKWGVLFKAPTHKFALRPPIAPVTRSRRP